MDLKLQAKLLQVLQDGEIHRLGGKEPVRVDVRVLVATHRDLEKSIAEGNFREDLYYRLNVVSIEVPPLRERKDEILPLAEHFLEKHCQPDAKPPALTEDLKRAFLAHEWPGNVRELENVVRRYLVFEDAPSLARQLLAASSARAEARSGNSHSAGDAAAIGAGRPDDRHVVAAAHGYSVGSGLDMSSAATPAAAQSSAAAPSQSLPADAEHGEPNGTLRMAATAGVARPPSRESAQPPAETNLTRGVARSWLEADPAADSAPPSARPFQDAESATLRGGLPQNADGWMSRLARLESLLGCLVLGAPEKPPAVAEPASELPSAVANENGRELVTLGEIDEERNRVETQAILAALEKTEWNRKKAAKLLKTDYKALLYRMKKLGVGERNDQA